MTSGKLKISANKSICILKYSIEKKDIIKHMVLYGISAILDSKIYV